MNKESNWAKRNPGVNTPGLLYKRLFGRRSILLRFSDTLSRSCRTIGAWSLRNPPPQTTYSYYNIMDGDSFGNPRIYTGELLRNRCLKRESPSFTADMIEFLYSGLSPSTARRKTILTASPFSTNIFETNAVFFLLS